ncbi:single-stranded-DNA-specific exonuclease RecJ [Altericista sp. CCNU0014]|uniref:single-stranded-DNA-specific exonuclease RecJ n=1 Tax=Altericista sp. CCNU0014 TaxID=3082949 RepID=UPI00384DD4AF
MPSQPVILESKLPLPQIHLPNQRWQIHPQDPEQALRVAQTTQLSPLLAQVLLNRGLATSEAIQFFLEPESQDLPVPLEEFPDLAASLELLETAIRQGDPIAICGDYDADGMTSTALLLRALKALGAKVEYAIPSRMHEGYGINERIVEDFAAEGVKLVLTVDNGIAAYDPIAKARELGLAVIVTDHHDLPPQLPPANAILNPKLLSEGSLYSGLAGVGVAYILAVALAQQMGQTQQLVTPLLELFTLGTIADLAPLIGVNRRWLQRGLKRLPYSEFAGVKALIEVSGSSSSSKQAFKPETIGFRLGPRINAVGRIGDPQTVIELLTTDDTAIARTRAAECELANQQRQQMCREIEQAAIALVEQNTDGTLDPLIHRVLVVVEPDWHHGVIGIVASRLVERYGVPVFIGTYEGETQTSIRGSARSIPEFDVFEALHFCGDLLDRFGGHRAAGGFTLASENLEKLRSRLGEFAHQHLKPEHLKPLVNVDVQAQFADITPELYEQIDRLQPCGIGNPEPVFWSANVKVLDQRIVGQNHLKVTLSQDIQTQEGGGTAFTAIAWRWAEYFPLPERVDVAYRLRENTWNGQTALELELAGARLAERPRAKSPLPQTAEPKAAPSERARVGRSPLLPKIELELKCPEPPAIDLSAIRWHSFNTLEEIAPQLVGNVLLYGYQRPYVSAQILTGELTYDRPRSRCATVLLWTLPPSWTHLRWLLAIAKPDIVCVRNDLPKLPDAKTVRSQLSFEIVKNPDAPINLLDLGQQWWVSPSTLVATLREMKYPCPSFAATASLEQELERLQRWYNCSAQRLAALS